MSRSKQERRRARRALRRHDGNQQGSRISTRQDRSKQRNLDRQERALRADLQSSYSDVHYRDKRLDGDGWWK